MLFSRASGVGFGHRQRQLIALPRLRKHTTVRRGVTCGDANGVNVRVRVASVSAMTVLWIGADALVEIPVTRQVVIQADDVRRARLVEKCLELTIGVAAT